MDARTRLLLEGPVSSTILRLSLPNVIVMVVQTSIGLIETYFVSELGLDALAGMALVFPLYMLLQMVTAGAMGGAILSAVARALGSGHRYRANELVWYAVAVTIVLGALTTVATLLFAPRLYALMGGRDGSLTAATTYSAVVFAGTIPLWLFNSFAAVIRGTGNMFFPAAVMTVGAVVLIPLSPVLIFGLGPFPQLGIAGGAAAVVLYYAIGCAIFATYIWSGRGVLKASLIPPKLAWAPNRDSLRVGAASSVVSLSTNIIIATATGLAGLVGPAVVAGYGTGVRLEYLRAGPCDPARLAPGGRRRMQPPSRAAHGAAVLLCTERRFGGRQLAFRIGINSGPVVAGVIGRKKFIYDLWGQTVNLASRMEFDGRSRCVQITRSTYDLINDSFDCEALGLMEVKGTGPTEVWHVIGRRSALADKAIEWPFARVAK